MGEGFSLRAGTSVHANDADGLSRLEAITGNRGISIAVSAIVLACFQRGRGRGCLDRWPALFDDRLHRCSSALRTAVGLPKGVYTVEVKTIEPSQSRSAWTGQLTVE